MLRSRNVGGFTLDAGGLPADGHRSGALPLPSHVASDSFVNSGMQIVCVQLPLAVGGECHAPGDVRSDDGYGSVEAWSSDCFGEYP